MMEIDLICAAIVTTNLQKTTAATSAKMENRGALRRFGCPCSWRCSRGVASRFTFQKIILSLDALSKEHPLIIAMSSSWLEERGWRTQHQRESCMCSCNYLWIRLRALSKRTWENDMVGNGRILQDEGCCNQGTNILGGMFFYAPRLGRLSIVLVSGNILMTEFGDRGW